ncbi:MAG: cobalamin biosynthesis protein, partial [Eubacterium sp.]|nr:cobalamin biosynthesis protein [Eubacterium sp.]
MKLIYAMILGFFLDLLIGDPHGLIHPVQIIGWFITKLKNTMQRLIYGCSYREAMEKGLKRKEKAELLCGYLLTTVIVLG